MSLTRNGSDGSAGVAALSIARPLSATKKRGLRLSAGIVLPPLAGGPEHRGRNRDTAEERDEGEPPTAVPTPAGSEGEARGALRRDDGKGTARVPVHLDQGRVSHQARNVSRRPDRSGF